MRKSILTLAALAAALLTACNKEPMIEPEITHPVQSSAPLVFTATMEGAPESKATFDNAASCASWQEGDKIILNGVDFIAKSTGTSTTFIEEGVTPDDGVRPTFVSSTTTGSYQNQPATNLVDSEGTSTRWIANKTDRVNGVWNIVVSTGKSVYLKSIKLWNADNQTYPGRRWKTIKLYGSTSQSGEWEEISDPAPATSSHPFNNLNLAINKQGLAGEIAVNSTKAYTFYRIDVFENEGDKDGWMQMSDMKFVVSESKPLESPYTAYFPADLYQQDHLILPSRITEMGVDVNFNMPMYAYSENTNLLFKNLCGVLKIVVKRSQMENVKQITVRSSNRAMSGAFTVDENSTAILLDPTDASLATTVNYTYGVRPDTKGTAFYVAIPAQTYQDLTIVVSDGTDCKDMVTKSGRDIVVERNKMYSVTFEDNTPYSGYGIAVIDGVEVEVPWVQLYAGGPKWATYNVGAEHSRPEDYGGYYAWGGCINKGDDYYADDVNLTGEHNTATKLWGNNWRMPSFDELFDVRFKGIPYSITTINGVKGILFTGKDNCSCNSLFIPYSGYYENGTLRHVTERAWVWAGISQRGIEPGEQGEIYRNIMKVMNDGAWTDRADIRSSRSSVRAVFNR